MGRGWSLWACLAAGVALALWAVSVRDPLPATAPPDVFSAGRAMADVRLVGREPHPIGSPANERVRQALTARMAALGLDPQVREAVGIDTPKSAPTQLMAGLTHSLVGVSPGADRTLPAVLVMAHYDSVPNSPGAADDGAGVASALEIVRLLKATGPHRRDVIVLLSDGEEPGLLGAEAFFAGDPLRSHVGAVVNMEARGDAGRTAMFETGQDNAGMIRLYAATARAPFANSLTAFLYHRLPNNTDFTHAYVAGLPGLNFAFSGDQLAYHTPLATPDHLSKQTLQHMGDQAAPAVRALADAASLPARGPDLVYFDVFGRGVLAYPLDAGWLVWGAGLLLLVAARVGAARREGAGVGEVLRGAATAAGATAAAALAGHVAGRWLDGAGYAAGYHLYRAYDLLFLGAGLLALGAALWVYASAGRGRGVFGLAAGLLAAALLSLTGGFDGLSWGLAAGALVLAALAARRPLTPAGGRLGALVLVGVLAGTLQLLAPLAAPIAAWPFVLAAGGAAVWAWTPGPLRGLGVGAAAGVAVILLGALGALADGMFTAIGPALPEVLAVFVLILTPAFAPFALAPFALSRGAGRGAAVTAAGIVVMGALAVLGVGFGRGTAARPGLADAFYWAPSAGAQLRLAPVPHLDPWSRAAIALDGGRVTQAAAPPLFPAPVWQAPARRRPVAPPVARLERAGGAVRLTALPTGGGRVLWLFVRGSAPIADVSVNGRVTPLTAAAGRWAVTTFAAPPATGVILAFPAPAGARFEAEVLEQRDGWPPGAAPSPKPPGTMAWRDSDTTIAGARATLP